MVVTGRAAGTRVPVGAHAPVQLLPTAPSETRPTRRGTAMTKAVRMLTVACLTLLPVAAPSALAAASTTSTTPSAASSIAPSGNGIGWD